MVGGLLFLGLTLVVLLTFFVVLFRREWHFAAVLLFAYVGSLALFWKVSYPIHDNVRWVLQGSAYRKEVLHQQPVPGEFQHVEWDGWGGMGAGDTVAYLVFDQADSLAAPARNHNVGKFRGIPCGVSEIHRFSRQWYAVTMYTDTDWNDCP